MRKVGLITCASLAIAAAPVKAQERGAQERDAEFAPFEVTRTPARRGHPIAMFEIAGESVALAAYGRKARARMFDASRELREARAMSRVFEGAPQPALVTFEMRVSF